MPVVKWLEIRLRKLEQKLRSMKVRVDFNGLWKQLGARPRRLAKLSPHILAVLDFIERMVQLHGTELIEIKTETDGADIIMVINKESYAFQVKTRDPIMSKTTIKLIKSANRFVEENINDFGIFLRAIIDDSDNQVIVTERRVIDKIDDYSIAGLYKYIGVTTMQHELKRIRQRLREAARQLEGVSANSLIIVYDSRYVPVSTSHLIDVTRGLLHNEDFQHINGIVYMRMGIERFSRNLVPYLFPIPNPRSSKPLNERFYYYSQANYILLEPCYMFILPIHIYIKETGWNDLLDVRPGFNVFRKGTYMGSIRPPSYNEIF